MSVTCAWSCGVTGTGSHCAGRPASRRTLCAAARRTSPRVTAVATTASGGTAFVSEDANGTVFYSFNPQVGPCGVACHGTGCNNSGKKVLKLRVRWMTLVALSAGPYPRVTLPGTANLLLFERDGWQVLAGNATRCKPIAHGVDHVEVASPEPEPDELTAALATAPAAPPGFASSRWRAAAAATAAAATAAAATAAAEPTATTAVPEATVPKPAAAAAANAAAAAAAAPPAAAASAQPATPAAAPAFDVAATMTALDAASAAAAVAAPTAAATNAAAAAAAAAAAPAAPRPPSAAELAARALSSAGEHNCFEAQPARAR